MRKKPPIFVGGTSLVSICVGETVFHSRRETEP